MLDNAVSTINGVVNGAITLLLSLAGLALIIDLLFGATTNIVSNVSSMVSQFTTGGLVGLITLIVFVAILQRD